MSPNSGSRTTMEIQFRSEIMNELDLLRLRRAGSRTELAAASHEVVAHSLVLLLLRCGPDLDFDEMMKVGIMLRSTGHRTSDRVAIDWMSEEATAVRVDATCAFLCGFWVANDQSPPVEADTLRRLIAARPSERLSPDADYSFAQAVARPIVDPHSSPEVVALSAAALKEAVARGTGDSALDRQLHNLGAVRLDTGA